MGTHLEMENLLKNRRKKRLISFFVSFVLYFVFLWFLTSFFEMIGWAPKSLNSDDITVWTYVYFVLPVLLSWRAYRFILVPNLLDGISKREWHASLCIFFGTIACILISRLALWVRLDASFKNVIVVILCGAVIYYLWKKHERYNWPPMPHIYKPFSLEQIQSSMKDQFCKTNSASQLVGWVKDFQDVVRTNIENGDITLKKSYRYKEGIFKQFQEEALPVAIFAKRFLAENSQVELCLGNQNFDAKVFDAGFLDYLEVTYPIDGYLNRLQMEHLNIHEDAPLTVSMGKDEIRDRIRNGEHIPADAVDHEYELTKQNERLLQAAQKKFVKKYPDCTTFLIAEYFIKESDAKNCANFLRDNLKKPGPFKSIYLINLNGDVFPILT